MEAVCSASIVDRMPHNTVVITLLADIRRTADGLKRELHVAFHQSDEGQSEQKKDLENVPWMPGIQKSREGGEEQRWGGGGHTKLTFIAMLCADALFAFQSISHLLANYSAK